jgi:hypothetical protein
MRRQSLNAAKSTPKERGILIALPVFRLLLTQFLLFFTRGTNVIARELFRRHRLDAYGIMLAVNSWFLPNWRAWPQVGQAILLFIHPGRHFEF